METGLRKRLAIVAASSQGIGRATALGFAAEGANLALCARNAEALNEVAEEARRVHGVEVYTENFDVADDGRVRKFAAAAHSRFGRLDICVTNAGGPPSKQFADTTMEEWDRAYQLNLRSIVSFAHAVLPYMRQSRWGRLITITSVSVRQPLPDLVLSNTIRTGVLGLVRSLASQSGPFNITVNNVGPGYTATERMANLAERRERRPPGSRLPSLKRSWPRMFRWAGSPSQRKWRTPSYGSPRSARLTSPGRLFLSMVERTVGSSLLRSRRTRHDSGYN